MFELEVGKFQYFDIRNAVYADWNYKEDHEEQMKKLIRSILSEGFIVNCLIRLNERGEYEVIDGNHRKGAIGTLLDLVERKEFLAVGSEELTWVELYEAKGFDFSKIMCYYLGEISQLRAKEIALKTNGSWFDDNETKKRDIIQELFENYGETFFDSSPFEMEDYIEPDFEPVYGNSQDIDKFDGTIGQSSDTVRIKFSCPLHIFQKWEDIQKSIQIEHNVVMPSDILEILIDSYEQKE